MASTTKEKEEVPIFGDALANLTSKDFPKKPAKRIPKVSTEKIKQTAETAGFQAGEAKESDQEDLPQEVPVATDQRRYRTGRNVQINIKIRAEDREEFLKITDERFKIQGLTFQRMLEALQREIEAETKAKPKAG